MRLVVGERPARPGRNRARVGRSKPPERGPQRIVHRALTGDGTVETHRQRVVLDPAVLERHGGQRNRRAFRPRRHDPIDELDLPHPPALAREPTSVGEPRTIELCDRERE